MVLAASRVENLMTDIADIFFSDKKLAGLSVESHSYGDKLRDSIATNDKCATCRGIVSDLQQPFDARNMYVHASWHVGKDIASKEEKERRALELSLFPDTVVTKRRRMGKRKIEALVARWETGDIDALDTLFESEVVSLGFVAALSETFTKAAEALEEELTAHEKERKDKEG